MKNDIKYKVISLLFIFAIAIVVWLAVWLSPTAPVSPVSPVSTSLSIAAKIKPTATPIVIRPEALEMFYDTQEILILSGQYQEVAVEGVDFRFICRKRTHFLDTNTMKFWGCTIYVDDADLLYKTFKVYFPIVGAK